MIWPWTYVRERLDAIADQALTIRDLVESLRYALNRPLPEPPAPLVLILVEGESGEGEFRFRYVVGHSTRVREQVQRVVLDTDVPLAFGRVTVFADPESVMVAQIMLANAPISSGAPYAFFSQGWSPAHHMTVYLQRVGGK